MNSGGASRALPPSPKGRHDTLLLLGSNIRPADSLPAARQRLTSLGQIIAVSRVWESRPVGFLEQPNFCNAAVRLLTDLEPAELKRALREIETGLGRVRDPQNKNAPRTIDLDIGLYDDRVCGEPGLTIPDPEITRRAFVAIPLAEIAPETRHPVTGRRLAEIAADWDGTELQLRTDIRL